MSINSIFKPNDYDIYLNKVHVDDAPDPLPATTAYVKIDKANNRIYTLPLGPGPPVEDIVLIGNPVHQFVSGGSGTLNFRGMLSPDDSIAFNVTPTNIEMIAAIPDYDIQVTRVVYVATDAVPAAADGSPYKPYQTIQHALDVINGFGDATADSPYLIECAPGTYVEGNLILYPFISIAAQSCDIVGSQLTFVSLDISNLDQTGGTNFVFSKMTINSTINIDTSTFGDGVVMIFLECNLQSNVNYNGGDQSIFVIKYGVFNGPDITATGGKIFIDSNFTAFATGTISLDSGIGQDLFAELTGNEFSGRDVVIGSSNVGQTVSLSWDSSAATFNSVDDASISLQINNIPITNNIGTLLATVVSRTADCIGLGFNTTVPSLWSLLPNNVSTALDVLASSQWRIINDPGTAVLGFGGSGSTTTLGTSGITDMTLVGSGTTVLQGNTITNIQSTGGSVAVSAATTLTTTAGTNLVDNGNTITLNGTLSVSLTTPLLICGSTATTNFNRINTVVNTGLIRLGGALDTNSMQINYGGPILLSTPGPATGIFISTSLLAAVASNASYKGRVSFQAVGTTITNIYSSYFTYVVASNGFAYVISYQNETDKYTNTAPVVTSTLVISGGTNIAVRFTFNGFAQNLSLRFQNTFTRIA